MIKAYLFALAFAITLKCQYVDLKQTELILAIQSVRHGARYPLYKFEGMQMDAKGELSQVGARQLYELGRIMRQKYVENDKFISDKYQHHELFIRSTDKTRTLMSAQSFLYGLYPQGTGPEIPQNQEKQREYLLPPHQRPAKFTPYNGSESIQNRIQPIPIHTIDLKTDEFLLNTETDCQKLESIRKYYQEIEMNKLVDLFKEEFKQFLNIVKDEDQALDIVQIHKYIDGLICNEYNGVDLPQEWKENKQFQKRMKDIYSLVFTLYYFGNEEAIKLSITPYFKQILKFIDDKINQKQPIKYYGLFTHDVTIISILNALQLASWQCIKENIINNQVSPGCTHYGSDFASDILLELRYHKSTQQYMVVTFFNGEVIELKKGQKYLALDDFRQILQSQIIDNYDETCRQDNQEQQNGLKLDIFSQFKKEFSGFSKEINEIKYLLYFLVLSLIIMLVISIYQMQVIRRQQIIIQLQKKIN